MRKSGILLHITSLPCEYGIGDLGPQAYDFLKFLSKADQRCWQVLPLTPLGNLSNPSPYDCTSAFAGNTLLISPQLLYEEGYLQKTELAQRPDFKTGQTDYRNAARFKDHLFEVAFKNFCSIRQDKGYENFLKNNSNWLEDWALFSACKGKYKGAQWIDWPAYIKNRRNKAVESLKFELSHEIEKAKFLQFIFFSQVECLRQKCKEHQIELIGDLPIYVGYDSSDVWSKRDMFKLTAAGIRKYKAGVPPDYFSRNGQLWGSPVYNWTYLKKHGYRWWVDRLGNNLKMFDRVRIDHFRGFAAYWQVPADHRNAKNGRWVAGPGSELLDKLVKTFGSESLIAEDLGMITDDVRELIDNYSLPGMRVLQFAFSGGTKNEHNLYNHPQNSIVYTGTHDNNTTRSWYRIEASSQNKRVISDMLGFRPKVSTIHQDMIRLAMLSPAVTAIIPMQDVLGLDEKSRMNKPGTTKGNWLWQLKKEDISGKAAAWLKKISNACGRNFK